jgi:hypothetical protein
MAIIARNPMLETGVVEVSNDKSDSFYCVQADSTAVKRHDKAGHWCGKNLVLVSFAQSDFPKSEKQSQPIKPMSLQFDRPLVKPKTFTSHQGKIPF